MSIRPILILCIALASGAGALAQPQPPPQKPAAEQPPPPPRLEPMGQPVNIRVDLAIADQIAIGEPLKKTLTLLVADRARGSIRNSAGARGYINADAYPTVLPSGAIRLQVGLEYTPTVGSGAEIRTLSQMNEQLTVVLESGKPLVISNVPDPTSDRKVTVQVTAQVVR
jgi:hypothetical protein